MQLLNAFSSGDELTARARVTGNYEKKGHRFVELDALVVANGARRRRIASTSRSISRANRRRRRGLTPPILSRHTRESGVSVRRSFTVLSPTLRNTGSPLSRAMTVCVRRRRCVFRDALLTTDGPPSRRFALASWIARQTRSGSAAYRYA